jgi:hypothetical protein
MEEAVVAVILVAVFGFGALAAVITTLRFDP